MKFALVTLATALLLIASHVPGFAVTAGQIDTFDGTTADWIEGFPSPNPPTLIAGGGPGGAGDSYLQNIAVGQFGPGSRQIMYNQNQWTGDYGAAGVTAIECDLANFGTTTMYIRFAFGGDAGRAGSTDAFELPADGQWYHAVFSVDPSALSAIFGDVAATMADVNTVRLLTAQFSAAWLGDILESTLGVDNIKAVGGPVATESSSFSAVKGLFGN